MSIAPESPADLRGLCRMCVTTPGLRSEQAQRTVAAAYVEVSASLYALVDGFLCLANGIGERVAHSEIAGNGTGEGATGAVKVGGIYLRRSEAVDSAIGHVKGVGHFVTFSVAAFY